jgi:ATP phosphoribosyltransferase
LKENGLIEQEVMFEITSRLIANRVSYRMKNEPIQRICDHLQAWLG